MKARLRVKGKVLQKERMALGSPRTQPHDPCLCRKICPITVLAPGYVIFVRHVLNIQ